VGDAGFWVRARDHHLAPGCEGVGPGITVPKLAGAYDTAGLVACLRKLKELGPAPRSETAVTLFASPAVELQAIASVMDGLLGTAETGPLFPDVHFGVNRDTDPHEDDGADRGKALADLADPRAQPAGASPGTTVRGTGTASIGGVALSGGPVDNASAVVAGMAAGFRRCYNKGLRENPEMKGTIRITAKIGPNGEVLSVSTSESGLSREVASCVSARVSSAQFAPPEGGGATFVVPVTFTSK
jgi:TonB family protein